MAKLNEKQKILAFAGGGLFLALLGGGGVYWAKGLVEEKQQTIAADEKKIDEAKGKINKIKGLEDQVIILRENVGSYTKILPDESEANELVRTTNEYAQKAGVYLKQMLEGARGKRGKYSHYSYRLEIEATLWEFLKLCSLFENHERFIRVVSFSLGAADEEQALRATQKGESAVHKITMVIETFVYNGGSAKGNVKIAKYDQRRALIQNEIEKGAQALMLERYDYKENRARRDIFVDPRPRRGGTGNTEGPIDLQDKQLEQFITRVNDLVDHAERLTDPDLTYVVREKIERRLEAEVPALQADAAQVAPMITSPAHMARWNKEVEAPMRNLAGILDIDDTPGSLEISADAIAGLREEMLEDVERGNYEAAIKRFEEKKELLAGFDEEDPRFAESQSVVKLKMIIELAVEFSELPMEIKGVVVFEEGRSGLLVNGRVYEEGEYLDDNLLLKSVASESADFVYKGYSMRKKW